MMSCRRPQRVPDDVERVLDGVRRRPESPWWVNDGIAERVHAVLVVIPGSISTKYEGGQREARDHQRVRTVSAWPDDSSAADGGHAQAETG